MSFSHAIEDARFVLVDGQPLKLSYSRTPDEFTQAEDIIVEAESDDAELSLTLQDFDEAVEVGPGFYRLRSGSTVGFVSPATVH